MTEPAHITFILNRDGGTSRGLDCRKLAQWAKDKLAGNHAGFTLHLVSGSEIIDALSAAEENPETGVIVAGGGDGTISAAAAACYRSDKTLAVVPLGTMNLFARSLGMPLDPARAVEALASAVGRDLDIATANGRPFIHQYSVGLHSRLVRLRSGMDTSTRLRKISATVAALGQVALDPPRFNMEIDMGSGYRQQMLSAVSISNNLLGDLPLPYAERLDAGVLGITRSSATRTASVIRMTLAAVSGKLRSNPDLTVETAQLAVLRFPSPPKGSKAAIDGEIVPIESEIEFKSHPGALRVLVPQPEAA